MFTFFGHFTLRSTSLRSRSCKIRSKKKRRRRRRRRRKGHGNNKEFRTLHRSEPRLSREKILPFNSLHCLPVLTDIINYFQSQLWLWSAYLSLSDLITIAKVITVINMIFSLSLFFVSFCCCCWLFVLIFCILSFEASQVLKKVTNQVT